ncbi:TPA: hypothetical protein ACFP4Q_001980 [Neisseria weaveri]
MERAVLNGQEQHRGRLKFSDGLCLYGQSLAEWPVAFGLLGFFGLKERAEKIPPFYVAYRSA